MSDQRPQYGEYATPEEQRRLAGLPPVDAAPAPAPAPAEPVAPASAPAATSAPRFLDRIATIALLTFGLLNVLSSFGTFTQLEEPITEAMTMLGVEGEFTNFAGAKLWGTVAAVVLIVLWIATLLLSLRRLRQRKLAWWVPVVGGVVALITTSICISFVIAGDPAFIAGVS